MAAETIRVLLVEEDPVDARLFTRLLNEAPGQSVEVTVVDRLAAALARLGAGGLDVVLLDLSLPDGHGLETFARIQSLCPDVPVVMITGLDDEALALQALGQGVQDYLVKSQVDGPALTRTIRYAIERKRGEEALRQGEERYRRLFAEAENLRQFNANIVENMAEGLLLTDAEGRITFVNPRLERMVGYRAAEVLGRHWSDFVRAEAVSALESELARQAGADGGLYEGQVLTKDGHALYVLATAIPFRQGANVAGTLVSLIDITERKRAEAELELQGAALAAAANAIVIVDRQGTITWINPAFTRLTGYTAEEAVGSSTRLLRSGYHDQNFYKRLWETVLAGQVWQGELINRRKDGSLYNEEQTITPVLDETGAVRHFIAIKLDITRRKQAEDQTQTQLERLAALRTIDLAITGSLDLKLVLNIFLEQALAQLQADAAAVLLYNAATLNLEQPVRRGFRTAALQHTHLHLGQGLAGQAALERRRVSIPDLSAVPGLLTQSPLLAAEGFIAYQGMPLIAKGQVKGVLEIFNRQPFSPGEDWLNFLAALAGQAAIAIDNAELFVNLQRSNQDLAIAYDATIEGWSRALDLRDRETEGHTQRVTELSLRLARMMGVRETELVHMRRGALLHDIGKLAVPDTILLKPGPLTVSERETMRQHPRVAYNWLSTIEYLRPALDIPYCHHEKWDGTGYPRSLKGEQIPLLARIFAVVDVWDALCSDRPYRPAWLPGSALDYIREQSGQHFDPHVVEAFVGLVAE